jgi:cobalt-zinc-cadmium efflux system protein
MIALPCTHEGPACAIRHYGYATLALLVTLIAQVALTYLSGSVVVAGDTLHLASDLFGTFGTWMILVLMLRMYVDESTSAMFVGMNVLLLIGGGVLIAGESYARLHSPIMPDRGFTLCAGVVGLIGNILAVRMLHGAQGFSSSLFQENHRVNLLHLRSDAWLSGAVILSAVGSIPLGMRVDAVIGLLVAIYVINEGVGSGYRIMTGKHYPLHLHNHDH